MNSKPVFDYKRKTNFLSFKGYTITIPKSKSANLVPKNINKDSKSEFSPKLDR